MVRSGSAKGSRAPEEDGMPMDGMPAAAAGVEGRRDNSGSEKRQGHQGKTFMRKKVAEANERNGRQPQTAGGGDDDKKNSQKQPPPKRGSQSQLSSASTEGQSSAGIDTLSNQMLLIK